MKIQDLLLEEEAKNSTAAKLAAVIKRQAKPWLAASENGKFIVYRGVEGIYRDAGGNARPSFVLPIRTDRKPLHSSDLQHRIFNAIISLAGGYANRTNSAFVTPKRETAMSYGAPYVFVPLGNFRYTHSPVWGDWTLWATYGELFKLLKPQIQRKAIDRMQYRPTQNWWTSSKSSSYAELRLAHRLSLEALERLGKEAWNPDSYDSSKVLKTITADRDLLSVKSYEIMIAAKRGLYIDPELYELEVLPLLQEKRNASE